MMMMMRRRKGGSREKEQRESRESAWAGSAGKESHRSGEEWHEKFELRRTGKGMEGRGRFGWRRL